MPTPDRFAAPARTPREVYLGNASHGLPSAPVLEAMQDYLVDEAEWGGALAYQHHEDQLMAAYAAAARLIGAQDDEIAFLDSGNRALQALILALRLQPGDHVLVDRTCWGGTLTMLADLPGVVVDVMPVDAQGRADAAAARTMVHADTRCILLTWCPSTSGIVNPAREIGVMAREMGVLYLIDACQALGQVPVDVQALGCHALAASGRKWLRGPRGTAVLYASRAFMAAHPAFMPDQQGAPRQDARAFESGEASYAARLALGVAIAGALAMGVEDTARQLGALAGQLRAGLRALPGVDVLEGGADLSAIVTFRIDGVAEAQALADLARQGFRLGAPGLANAPFDLRARGLSAVLRAAPQLYTSAAQIAALVEAVAKIGA